MLVAAYILGALTIISALGVVSSQKPLNSALYLVVTLFLVAAHFALLEAHFLAATQILIYAGAIMVLVIFVIMLLGLESDPSERMFRSKKHIIVSGLIIFTLALLVGLLSWQSFKPAEVILTGAEVYAYGTTEEVGAALIERYGMPLQIIGLMLLAATIGAVMLALDKKRPLAEGRGLKAVKPKATADQEVINS